MPRTYQLATGVDGAALWRRHGRDTALLLDRIEAQPAEATELLPGTGILECEVRYASAHQMVVKLEDFLRRRTLLEMTRGREFLRSSDGARRICELLFGPAAEERWEEFAGPPAPTAKPPA